MKRDAWHPSTGPAPGTDPYTAATERALTALESALNGLRLPDEPFDAQTLETRLNHRYRVFMSKGNRS